MKHAFVLLRGTRIIVAQTIYYNNIESQQHIDLFSYRMWN
jgi:hypothetical protein